MQALVRSLVRSELASPATECEPDERALQAAFLRVFRQLSCAPRAPGAVTEVAEELVARHLQGLRKDRGVDRHLRFQGLKSRLQRSGFQSGRSGIFVLLFFLRGETSGGDTRKLPASQALTSLSTRHHQREKSEEPQNRQLHQAHVGWRLGTGAPSALPEAKLVRDLLFALQGVGSDCFKFDASFEVDPAVVLSRPAWELSQRVLELATLHRHLSAAAAAAAAAGAKGTTEGLLRQALGEALRQQLQDYYEALAQLSGERSTLLGLWARLLRPRARLGFLAAVAAAGRGVLGGALASTVFALAQSGDVLVQEAAGKILSSVVKPLLGMIRAWMTEGELQDPFGEFFVAAASSVPLSELWTRMYFLELEMVPSFLSLELARKILLTGKSVNFIRLCCPGQSWSSQETELLELQEHEELRFAAAPLRGLAEGVERSALQTNEHLVKLLMENYSLGEHALALRRFLLLGQGDFVESLMDLAQEELNTDAAAIYRHQLMGLLDMALRQSNAQFCPADVLARLNVKLLSPSAGECGWDIFLLDYSIDAPIHVVFTPAAMEKYHRAFAFLWKLRRVAHGLARSWKQHAALQRHFAAGPAGSWHWRPEMRQTLHRCTCLRNEMHHVVQNVQSYACEVLETSWTKLQSAWQSCTDLDQVILQHERYLGSIEEGAFLASGCEAILSCITELLSMALDFCHLQDQACAASLEATEAMEVSQGQGGPFSRSLAECRAQLDGLGAAFAGTLRQLLASLQEQRGELDFSVLCCRLDFNSYYEPRDRGERDV